MWAGYYVLHSLLATRSLKKTITGTKNGTRSYRLFYVLFSATALFAIMLFGASIRQVPFYTTTSLTKFVSLVIATGGIFIIKGAFREVSFRGFIGLTKERGQLVTSGIYSKIRHPLYSGTLLIMLGYIVFSPKWTSVIVFGTTVVYLVVGIWLEDRKLKATFGEEYVAYKTRVPSLFPYKFRRG